ncbi:MAG: hypothetical protein Q8P50_11295 [Bacillota bacterium]|nr:hypothetical protein [Bacillota bacterium]
MDYVCIEYGDSPFLNYLKALEVFDRPGITEADEDVVLLIRHRDWILDGVKNACSRISSKYRWLAGYHNWYCQRHYSALRTLQLSI